jgi:hypothetical protein
MKASTIHWINSGLIILSCIIAFFIPFELFLFSYAVLGPLHYLTEIGWLHKKNYFTKGKYDFVLLTAACVMLVYWNYRPSRDTNLVADIIIFSILISIALVFIKDWLYRVVLILLTVLVVAFLNDLPGYFVWIAIFLPTIIHVFVFTWAFMLYGALKERSAAGAFSIIVLLGCAVALFLIRPDSLFYEVGAYTRKSYDTFSHLNFYLVQFFNLDHFTETSQIFTTKAGFVVMRFIAFAYTYHYLNWFSKTSVIKWHLVPRMTLAFTVFLWLLSIGIYAYDYVLGMNVLFFLSFLHVFLEFPLNVVSFTGIGKELFSLRR